MSKNSRAEHSCSLFKVRDIYGIREREDAWRSISEKEADDRLDCKALSVFTDKRGMSKVTSINSLPNRHTHFQATHTHTSHVIVQSAANYAARTWGNAKSHIYIWCYSIGITTQNANTCKNIYTKTQLSYSAAHTVHIHSHPVCIQMLKFSKRFIVSNNTWCHETTDLQSGQWLKD